MALKFGASIAIDPTAGDVVADIKGLTEGRGADVTIEALGRQDTFEAALRSLRPGGTLSSLGDHASSPRSVPAERSACGDSCQWSSTIASISHR